MTAALFTIGTVLVVLAALLHVAIFAMESVLWMRPAVFRRFGVRSAEDATTLRPMALNQGFYNLFLAIAGFVGAGLLAAGVTGAGLTASLVSVGSMLAAALVLVISNPRLARAAAIQGTLPLLAIVLLVAGAPAVLA